MRFYCEQINEGKIELPPAESHHLVSVYRAGKGEEVEVFDGKGTVGWGELAEVKNKIASLNIDKVSKYRRKYKSEIVIASSVAKSDKFEEVIKKCTELGVDRIIPVIFDRTVKKPKGKKRLRRWSKLTIESAKQCERLFLPQIAPPLELEETFSQLTEQLDEPVFLFGTLGSKACRLCDVYEPARDCVVFVGPEGGFSERELKFFGERNVAGVGISDNVLRIETAAIAFAALLADLRRKPMVKFGFCQVF